jgi:dTDP-4-amino-4,6-dideoxygalactose transaminase
MKRIPYGRQSIDEDDIRAVVDVLRSDWLTTGPRVAELEQAFAAFVGAHESVVVSNGTAALHALVFALGIRSGRRSDRARDDVRGVRERGRLPGRNACLR